MVQRYTDDTHLTPSEMESLFLRNSEHNATPSSPVLCSVGAEFGELDSYAHKTDCFRRTAKRIRVYCSELDMDEDVRVEGKLTVFKCPSLLTFYCGINV
jgi:hypothetical protein